MEFNQKIRYKKSFLNEKVAGNVLPQEIEEGNVEYKLKLVDPPEERLEHLITQMKWRIAEGHGECMYEVGVADDGQLVGLSAKDMESSISTLKYMASQLNADLSVVRRRAGTIKNHTVAEILVRKRVSDNQHFLEIRVAILGGADAGKSTLLGVLTHSELDNGRGKSRLNLLRHPHEIESGRTSSISHQIIGFDASGILINYRSSPSPSTVPSIPPSDTALSIPWPESSESEEDARKVPGETVMSSPPRSSGNVMFSSWEQVCENASKLVTFLDTCGHPKYQRTTISGISGSNPDYACLILGGNAGCVSEVPREHLSLAVALGVPAFVVITKIDVADRGPLTGTIGDLLKILRSSSIRRDPKVIQNEDDLVSAVSGMDSLKFIPIFLVSSVTGENIELLLKFLNLLPKKSAAVSNDDHVNSKSVEFAVEEVYVVPAVGTVLGGVLKSGVITAGIHELDDVSQSIYLLGPDRGRFVPVRISTIQRQRCSVGKLVSGEAGTLALWFLSKRDEDDFTDADEEDLSGWCMGVAPPQDFKIRKGQVLVPFDEGMQVKGEARKFGGAGIGRLSRDALVGSQPQTSEKRASVKTHHPSGLVWEFEAEIHVLHAPASPAAIGVQGVVYCGSVGQGARIIDAQDESGEWLNVVSAGPSTSSDEGDGMDGSAVAVRPRRRQKHARGWSNEPKGLDGVDLLDALAPEAESGGAGEQASGGPMLTSGGRAKVRFAFASEPEWIRVGSLVLFRHDGDREKAIKCVGKITRLATVAPSSIVMVSNDRRPLQEVAPAEPEIRGGGLNCRKLVEVVTGGYTQHVQQIGKKKRRKGTLMFGSSANLVTLA
ncbi:GTP binding protein [Phlyctochytrium planicorne]|nr:GTP binding protein [Phlyctochytrium planicorne]